jgi:hypothetical protein
MANSSQTEQEAALYQGTYQPLIDELRETFGMNFVPYHSGGGNWALRAPTETGHWLHITDAYESLSSWSDRVARWYDGESPGYGVSVFADEDASEMVYCNEDAFAEWPMAEVAALVRDALTNIPRIKSAR